MRRRDFITLAGGAAACPLTARAQQPNQIARIGYLSQESAAFDRSHGDSAAFRDGLGDLGYVEGRNLHIEFRYADADLDRLPALAAELVGLNVDIIVTYSVGTVAARRVTATIPIVQTVGSDLVAAGFARSLAHPGGNVTGSTFFQPELMVKRLEHVAFDHKHSLCSREFIISWLNHAPHATASALPPPHPTLLPGDLLGLTWAGLAPADRASFAGAFVAVGTRVTSRPPHRSVRAAFPHTAPTSGPNAPSNTR
jgi:hypothetical protein